MKLSALLAGTVVLGTLASVHGAVAAPIKCDDRVTGAGEAKNGANYDPPRTYNTEALAKKRAVENWSAAVKASCPGYSHLWHAATHKHFSCEGTAGGLGCEAIAHPHRRGSR